ncbi:hypothetical protein CQA29_26415 [Klebsiella pneumoniae]|uniref:Uncharacterized protein n=4 Tax=Enterobacteriaceae TaxID=543 RepID=A8ARS9_CITK8|nr:hypothetical protein CKO_pCKO3p06151 [Citrobacter koseri ATCC BAA-895]AHM88195.1 hypothetical protein KPNJ1_05799 [Klebsiella pneumoniae 30660/NJST258_1]APM17883.1 hypothetical protein AGG42_00060 [Klebsiella pneumoniae]ATV12217.1 hypothetical protein CDW44_27100 [Escherichia coli]ATY04053.1 hypothetical protein AM336_00020 [Klebsiella aerogenes]AVE70907.1 hypothetical protein AM351_24245 [Citrobacter koseri]EFJ79576.1 hypothetical protein HMPREF9534_04421 [Escherichia coli MS 69-1]EFZ821
MRFCENDQKNSHSHHAQSPPDATKTSTNGAVLRPQYVLLKSLYEIPESPLRDRKRNGGSGSGCSVTEHGQKLMIR